MAELSDIQAILFDTEGVIYHRPRQQRYLAAFLAEHELTPRHPWILERALRAARFDVITGRITIETYFDAILRTHGIAAPDLLEAGREALFEDAGDIELYPGVIETLTKLQDSGLRLGAVVDSPGRRSRGWRRGCYRRGCGTCSSCRRTWARPRASR
jgi:FMN phosphatase YigB (HAD superfamily)